MQKEKEVFNMLKQIAWNTFKNTGDINIYLELKQISNIEENMRIKKYETIESKRSNNSREDSIRL